MVSPGKLRIEFEEIQYEAIYLGSIDVQNEKGDIEYGSSTCVGRKKLSGRVLQL